MDDGYQRRWDEEKLRASFNVVKVIVKFRVGQLCFDE